jgi:DNA-directed RNA polymerase specialized sigma subunit
MSTMSIQKIEPIIKSIVKTMYKPTRLYDREDMIQAAYLEFLRVKNKYEDNHNTSEATFYRICIYRALLKFFRKYNKHYANQTVPEQKYSEKEQPWEFYKETNELDEQIFNMILQGYTKKSISKKLGVTRYKITKTWERMSNEAEKAINNE